MKNLIFVFGLLLFATLLNGQSFSDGILVNDINFDKTIPSSEIVLLRNNLQFQLGQLNGETAFGSLTCNAFLSQLQMEQITGIANKQVFKYALDLTFYDRVLDQEYDRATINLVGSGQNNLAAVKSAIQNIRTKGKELALIKEKVWQMQSETMQSCDKIIGQLADFDMEKNYTKILVLTNHISSDHPCYADIKITREKAYKAHQSLSCGAAIAKAKASMAINDFENASRYIGQVDPKMDCADEIDSLIAEMDSKFSAQQMKTMEWYIKYKSDEADIQKAQISIISNLVLKELIHAH